MVGEWHALPPREREALAPVADHLVAHHLAQGRLGLRDLVRVSPVLGRAIGVDGLEEISDVSEDVALKCYKIVRDKDPVKQLHLYKILLEIDMIK